MLRLCEKHETTYPVILQKLKNAQNDVVNVAEARSLALLRMMQTPRPIDSYVSVLSIKLHGGADGSTGRCLTELKKPVEDRTILADVEALEMARVTVVVERFGTDRSQKIHVVRRVKAADVDRIGRKRATDFHAAVEGIVDDEVVGHTDTVGLHGVALSVVVVSDCRLIEIRHAPLLGIGPSGGERRAAALCGGRVHRTLPGQEALT